MPRPPNRSHIVIMTDECRALRQIREMRQLSMRQAAEIFGWTSGYISHLENGRTKIPEGARLKKVLHGYGITLKSYQERVRRIRLEREARPDENLIESVQKLSLEQKELVRELVNYFQKIREI